MHKGVSSAIGVALTAILACPGVGARGTERNGAADRRCGLSAQTLEMRAASLDATGVKLRSAGLHLMSQRVSLSAGRLRIERPVVELCRRCAVMPPLAFRAALAWASVDHGRLHLRRPVLFVGRVPIAALPYWFLPLRAGVGGLLTPRLGYSPRDGLRVQQGIFLTPAPALGLALHPGWYAQRGAIMHSSVSYFSASGDGRVDNVTLRERGRWRAALKARAVVRSEEAALYFAPDLVSDPLFLDDLSFDNRRVASRYLRGVAGAEARWGALRLSSSARLLQELRRERVDSTPFTVVGAAGLSLPGLSLGSGLSLSSDTWVLGLRQSDGATARPLAVGLAATHHRLRWDRTLAGVRISAQLGYRGQIVDQSARRRTAQLGETALELALPMHRLFQLAGERIIRHRLEPFVGWSSAWGDPWTTNDATRMLPRSGGLIRAGLRSSLAALKGRLVGLSVSLALEPPSGNSWIAARSATRLEWLDLSTRLAVALQRPRRLLINARACLRLFGTRACGGYLRQRVGDVRDLLLDARANLADLPDLAFQQLFESAAADRISAELSIQQRSLRADLALYIDPVAARLTHASYRVSVPLGCDCYRLSVQGRSRLGQRWPDLMLGLSLGDSGDLRCLGLKF